MTFPRLPSILLWALLFALSPATRAQDLYDTSVLRTFHLTFHDANWLTLLRQNYASQTPILADLVVDGVTYPNVGVRIRGNTSYTALPAGSEKFSLKIYLDHVDPDQDLMGYDNINLNNGFRDPTFTREVVYNNFVARFIPNPRANHVQVTLNGQNWGVYNNIQQPNKSMLRSYFVDEDGVRISCQNNPNGPGLSYNGPNASGYTVYSVDNDGGLADPIAPLIAVTDALSNTPLANWPQIDQVFAIDPSIWSVALENLLTDDDSYINKGCDFVTYRDPIDGRMHLMQRDANETFTQTSWPINRNFTAANKPVLSRVLAVPELRQRYMAHYRTIRRDLTWDYLGPIFAAHRALIETAVQNDPKKIYAFTHFQNNFTATVNLGGGLAGGSLIGIQPFVQQRASFLAGNAELVAPGPTLTSAQASSDAPAPGTPVTITASVTPPAGATTAAVELFYRPDLAAPFLRVAMLDDGNSGDGAAGDGVYGVALPVTGTPGQIVDWYVAAVSSNGFASRAFRPELAERGPNTLAFGLGGPDGLRITEWMYAGANGEFIELTNLSDAPIDLSGWSLDDSNAVPGAFPLGAVGTLAPGESLIVTEAVADTFRAAWGLGAGVKILGGLGAVVGSNNLGRNDQIHVFNATNVLQDRLDYGDETFPGTIRTQNRSGQATCEFIGTNTVSGWVLSALGDAFGSFASAGNDLGTPGTFGGCSAGDLIFAHDFEP